ncbi:MAG TPA: beta-ketoacyl synthase [Pseudomonadales bacterium]|nr:beta-ketoacyl synthase [Pseudomonadales bacterium]
MSNLPVIVGLGGVNAAGRLSLHHAYRRMVIDALPAATVASTYRSLAGLMNIHKSSDDATTRDYINAHTLVRKIESFDTTAIPWQRNVTLSAPTGALSFRIQRRQLPDRTPSDWQISDAGDKEVTVTVQGKLHALIEDVRISRVTSAGQVPTGFDPDKLYQSRNHPRGLALTIFGASDAVRSLGIDWDVLRQTVEPDRFAVYSGSAMGQLDFDGSGGMMQSALMGKRVTSKQLPLGLCEMPADFINAYVLGSLGATGATIGACATFLYNLRQGVEDIQSGRRRVVMVGNSEAPITPEIIEGYRTMGALAEDEALMALDGRTDAPDNRRACRPFSDNCGFTLSEAAVYTVLMDDALALELGVPILGSVGNVYVNSDGFKKSIPGPGVGNYVTVAKAMALARRLIGEDGLRRRTYFQAHGTSTPQNRVTESHIISELAGVFGIEDWLVGAVKAYVGHSLAPAGGDQLAAILGAWQHGWIPGITTIDHIADDVHRAHLEFPMKHTQFDPTQMDGAFINSKGFGGNNATALILSPTATRRMLAQKHGAAALSAHDKRHEPIRRAIDDYDVRMSRGEVAPIYQFGEGVLEGTDIAITDTQIKVPGYAHPIDIAVDDPYPEMIAAAKADGRL